MGVARTTWGLGMAVIVLCTGSFACSSGASAPSAASTTIPEDRRASPAEVAKGLAKIKAIGADATAAVPADGDRAMALVDQIQDTWLRIEGTIKHDDPVAYLSFEDSIAMLRLAVEDDDPDTASRSVADLASISAAYREQHPA